MPKQGRISGIIIIGGMAILLGGQAMAQPTTLPGPADAGRIEIPSFTPPEADFSDTTADTRAAAGVPAPPGAEEIRFILQDVKFEGVTVFSPKQLSALFADNIGREVPLTVAWDIADALTSMYQAEGYFLSRGFVPAQEIDGGVISIHAIEGAVGEIDIPPDLAMDPVISDILVRIKRDRPLQLDTLERELLLLNDRPDIAFSARLEPAQEDRIRLVLTPEGKKGQTSLSLDNHGSRYLGPHQFRAVWQGSLFAGHETLVSATAGAPVDQMLSFSLQHKIPLSPTLRLEVGADTSNTVPGENLRAFDVESRASGMHVALEKILQRQRMKNTSVRLVAEARNSDSDIAGAALTRDKVRALRAEFHHDRSDKWRGYNDFSLTLSQGLDAFGATDKNNLLQSRLDAAPDFTKLQFTYNRWQGLTQEWSGFFSLSGQIASGSLYSSEEFGYGGALNGRAYDSSEILGDHGIATAVEMRYEALPPLREVKVSPFFFYDAGKVWNDNNDQVNNVSGMSAGAGFRLQHPSGINGEFWLAQPLTKPQDLPIYGGDDHSPRLSFKLGYTF